MTRSRAADMPTDAGVLTGSPPSPPTMASAASRAMTTATPYLKNDHVNPGFGVLDQATTRSLGLYPGAHRQRRQSVIARTRAAARTVVRTRNWRAYVRRDDDTT